jgi:UDP-glucose:(heptosyl)LPS alpha-1,3-glucosyltransferase
MKIALVIERMDTSRGGRETSTAQTALALARRGNDVTILCQRGSWRNDSVRVLELGREGWAKHRRLRRFVSAVQGAMASEKFDIVHTTLPIPGANIYQPRGGTLPAQRAAGQRRRTPPGQLVSWLAGPLNRFRREMASLEHRVVVDQGATCLAVSDMVAREFRRYYRRVQGVHVVYNAVDIPEISEEQRADWRQETRFRMGVTPSDVVFVTVATNFELKGIAEAIIAFAQWHHSRGRGPDGRLVVIGRELVEGYRRHAGLRDIGAKVIFEPPTDQVFRWFAAADACVLLSWYDPCSRVVLEATRWGIPSITTKFNGASEALMDGAGIVVHSPQATRQIADAMATLADPEKREACAAACREKSTWLGLERHVDELLAVYAKVRNP